MLLISTSHWRNWSTLFSSDLTVKQKRVSVKTVHAKSKLTNSDANSAFCTLTATEASRELKSNSKVIIISKMFFKIILFLQPMYRTLWVQLKSSAYWFMSKKCKGHYYWWSLNFNGKSYLCRSSLINFFFFLFLNFTLSSFICCVVNSEETWNKIAGVCLGLLNTC